MVGDGSWLICICRLAKGFVLILIEMPGLNKIDSIIGNRL
jgi:hypothetical protein